MFVIGCHIVDYRFLFILLSGCIESFDSAFVILIREERKVVVLYERNGVIERG